MGIFGVLGKIFHKDFDCIFIFFFWVRYNHAVCAKIRCTTEFISINLLLDVLLNYNHTSLNLLT